MQLLGRVFAVLVAAGRLTESVGRVTLKVNEQCAVFLAVARELWASCGGSGGRMMGYRGQWT